MRRNQVASLQGFASLYELQNTRERSLPALPPRLNRTAQEILQLVQSTASAAANAGSLFLYLEFCLMGYWEVTEACGPSGLSPLPSAAVHEPMLMNENF